MGFSRQGYWSGLPCPSPGDLPNPRTEPACPSFPAPASGFFITEPSVEDPICLMTKILKQKQYCNKFNKDFKSGPHQKKNFKIEIQIPMKNFCFYKLLQMELNHFPHFFSSAPVTSTFSLESSTSLSPILSSTGRTCSLGPRNFDSTLSGPYWSPSLILSHISLTLSKLWPHQRIVLLS